MNEYVAAPHTGGQVVPWVTVVGGAGCGVLTKRGLRKHPIRAAPPPPSRYAVHLHPHRDVSEGERFLPGSPFREGPSDSMVGCGSVA